MTVSIKSMRLALQWAEERGRKNEARSRVTRALERAAHSFGDGNYTNVERALEDAEAWLAYLQDPSIIDLKTPDGDTPTTPSAIERKFGKEPPA